MSARFAHFVSQLLQLFPARTSAPAVAGSRFTVRTSVAATVVILPLGPTARRITISLAPTTVLAIHGATRVNAPNVFAVAANIDATELLPPAERVAARSTGYLLELPRRALQSHCLRA